MRRGTNPTGAGQTWQNRAGMPSSVPPIAAPGAWLPTNCARIPFYGSPINSILRIGKQFYSGLNRYGEFYIYTNRGLGTSGYAFGSIAGLRYPVSGCAHSSTTKCRMNLRHQKPTAVIAASSAL
jgi:hypothetical protein